MRSVPPYNLGGTASYNGAIWAIFIRCNQYNQQAALLPLGYPRQLVLMSTRTLGGQFGRPFVRLQRNDYGF
jgi:hypothetical protein